MNRLLKFFVRPYNTFLFTTILSFLAWSVPSFDGQLRKGFVHPFDPSVHGLLIALLWLLIVFSTAFFGFKVGSALKINTQIFDKRASLDDPRVLKIMLILGLIGVTFVFLQIISSLGFGGIITALTGGQANQLKAALYENYSIGPASLRYVAIPAAALGLYNLTRKRQVPSSLLSVILLLAVAIVSSRLSVVYTVFIFLGLLATTSRVNFKTSHALVGLVIFFHLLFALNYSRNSNFYRSIGITNFYLAGISEVITYVGSPFQGFLAVSDNPSQMAGLTEEQTHLFTGISIELNTNSALLQLDFEDDLYTAITRIVSSVLLSSFLMALAWKNSRNVLILIFGALGYCFAEIWRIYLFGEGIVTTIIVSVLIVAAICILLPRLTLVPRRRQQHNTKRNVL